MKMNRMTFIPWKKLLMLGVAVGLGFSTRASADTQLPTVHLIMESGPDGTGFFYGYPQHLNANIVILTDAGTPTGGNVVTVSGGSGSPTYSFGVASGGVVTPNYNSSMSPPLSNTVSRGQTSGTPQGYSQTLIGTYDFFPNDFSEYASGGPVAFPDIYYSRVFSLSSPAQAKDMTVISTMDWNAWGDPGFPAIPILTGVSPMAPNVQTVRFDLRANKQDQDSPGDTCSAGCSSCSGGGSSVGLASASLERFKAGVVISDTPVSYTPGVGMNMGFHLLYRQRFNNQPTTFTYSNLGPQWQDNWTSYISGGPSNGGSDATHVAPDGNSYVYKGYLPAYVDGVGQTTPPNQGDYQTNQPWTHATLHYRQSPERYEEWLPGGTVEVYGQVVGTSPNKLYFLSSITDPQGNITRLTYDPNAAASGNAVLTAVTDPTGGQLIFTYSASDPLKIVKVTRSKDGLSAKFQYTSGCLSGITDTIGITSAFHYLSGTYFIDKMTTPYGATTFNSTDGASFLEADMTNPLGQTERIEYQETLSGSLVPSSESAAPTATGLSVDNSNLNNANSFYWTRRAMADAATAGITTDSAAFYAKAQVTHWAQSGNGSIAVPLSTKMPLEGRVWYNYPGMADADTLNLVASGGSTSPSIVARVLDDSSTQASYASYNGNGLVTQSVDPLGRTTNYNYATNGIDLLTVKQVNGGGQDTLATMTYNSVHLPLTVTDASGQVTHLTYNGQGQLLTSEDALSHTTTMAYDSNGDGYLHTVTGPVTGAMTSYTYDSAGRVQTVTDSEGYVLTMAYDNIDRPVSVTYPDSTTNQTVYNALDAVKTIDRQGRATYMKYDAIEELLQTTDPLGRTTKYSWCTCGGLSTLTDANNNVTTWGLDAQGRVTSKMYADSSAITYAYETTTSRLHTMTDALGSVATYAYNKDNTLAGTSYSVGSGVAATPNVSFGYDSVYNRVNYMVDGTGTTTYAYTTITGSVTTGAGQLHTVSEPVASSTGTITYYYDELGRATGRTIDGGSTVSTTFDALGRVTGVTNPLGAFTYAYVDTTSRLSSVTYPIGTGLSTVYSYFGNTGDQRLQTIQNLHGTTQLSRFDYTYNAIGTIASWTQQADSSTAVVNVLSYDNADQLTSNVQSGGATAGNGYNYDPAGNRLAETTLSGTTTTGVTASLFNNLNQLTSLSGTTSTTTVSGTTSLTPSVVTINGVTATLSGTTFSATVPTITGTNVLNITAKPTTGAPVTKRFAATVTGSATTALTYDANGNTTTDENGNTYSWDALNRLTKITYPSTAYTAMAYDGLSRRTQIAEYNSSGSLTSTKNYLWIGTEMAEERDASNTVTKRFFPQGEQQSGANYYYTFDHLGSTREMCNSSGTIVARYNYDPNGVTSLVSGTDMATFGFAGMQKHSESGLYMTLYRIYNAWLAIWYSRDPMGEAGGINLYGYVANDPVDAFDPLGLDSSAAYPGGHHYIPNPLRSSLNPEVQTLANKLTTGPLENPGDHLYDSAHRAYNKAVLDMWDEYKKENGITCDAKATKADIFNLYERIKNSSDPNISKYLDRLTGPGNRPINDPEANAQYRAMQANMEIEDDSNMKPKETPQSRGAIRTAAAVKEEEDD